MSVADRNIGTLKMNIDILTTRAHMWTGYATYENKLCRFWFLNVIKKCELHFLTFLRNCGDGAKIKIYFLQENSFD